ncbi:RimJ/RimL family protein N-acetyltransferase [Paenibacillus sp. DS2015]
MRKSDFSVVVNWVNSYDQDFLYQWAGNTYTYPLTEDQMENHYSRGINSIDSSVYIYKIIQTETQEVMGTVQLGRFDIINKEAVVGRFLIKADQDRGKGIGTKALEELVRIGFEEFSLHRMKLYVFHINTQAIRCYEKVGFVSENITKNIYQSISGDYWDGIEMFIDKETWQQDKPVEFKVE